MDDNLSPDDLKAILYGKLKENENTDCIGTPSTDRQTYYLNRRLSVALTSIRIGVDSWILDEVGTHTNVPNLKRFSQYQTHQ